MGKASKEYFRTYYLSRRKLYIDMLGSKCAHCSSINKLQFDHVDPSTKTFEVSKFMNVSKVRALEELGKCQLLCQGCHIKKTKINKEYATPWNKGLWQHGTISGYRKCRCNDCKLAYSLYKKKGRREKGWK